jgi:hypothetical protein
LFESVTALNVAAVPEKGRNFRPVLLAVDRDQSQEFLVELGRPLVLADFGVKAARPALAALGFCAGITHESRDLLPIVKAKPMNAG